MSEKKIDIIKPLEFPPVKVDTVNICGYEFPIFCSDAIPEDEIWLVGKDGDSIAKATFKGSIHNTPAGEGEEG